METNVGGIINNYIRKICRPKNESPSVFHASKRKVKEPGREVFSSLDLMRP